MDAPKGAVIKKKRIIAVLLAAMLLGCVGCSPAPGENWGPDFFLNGVKQDVYTSQYLIEETDVRIPFEAFMGSIGADFAESPYNRYQVQCYEIQGIRYIDDRESGVIAFEQPYEDVVEVLKAQGKTSIKADFQAINLLTEGARMPLPIADLERLLEKMGLDVTVEFDREAYAIRVTLREPEKQP